MTAPYGWAINHAPADNTVATISRAAVSGKTHYATAISISLEGVGANTAGIVFVLRDSTTGAGNVLWTDRLNNLANESKHVHVTFPHPIPGVIGQAMTLESAQPAASSSSCVNLVGFTE